MALIVEDGTGKTDAESYASVEQADAYIALTGTPVSWTGASTTTKEQALRIATRFVERAYGGRFVGQLPYAAQALSWPRLDARTYDDRYIESNEVPREVRNATIEFAKRHVGGTSLMPDLSSTGSVKSETVSAGGGVSVSTEYATPETSTGASVAAKYPEADLTIRPVLVSGVRLGRA